MTVLCELGGFEGRLSQRVMGWKYFLRVLAIVCRICWVIIVGCRCVWDYSVQWDLRVRLYGRWLRLCRCLCEVLWMLRGCVVSRSCAMAWARIAWYVSVVGAVCYFESVIVRI